MRQINGLSMAATPHLPPRPARAAHAQRTHAVLCARSSQLYQCRRSRGCARACVRVHTWQDNLGRVVQWWCSGCCKCREAMRCKCSAARAMLNGAQATVNSNI